MFSLATALRLVTAAAERARDTEPIENAAPGDGVALITRAIRVETVFILKQGTAAKESSGSRRKKCNIISARQNDSISASRQQAANSQHATDSS